MIVETLTSKAAIHAIPTGILTYRTAKAAPAFVKEQTVKACKATSTAYWKAVADAATFASKKAAQYADAARKAAEEKEAGKPAGSEPQVAAG